MKKVVFGVMIFLASFGIEVARAADIALLDSFDNTREFFRRRYEVNGVGCADPGTYLGREEYQRYFRGWEYVLNGQQLNDDFNAVIPQEELDPGPPAVFYPQLDENATDFNGVATVTTIQDEGVTEDGLKDFEILILSNTASLSADQSRAIQQWVLKGGKLIATYGSGYKDIIENPHDPELADPLKSLKGSTGGLHELWHDPWTKAFGTQSITPEDSVHPGIDVIITKNIGPTDLFEWSARPILSYGAEANLLVPRPEHFRTALGFLTFDGEMDALKKLYPAILLVKVNRGEVLYFAYAPEFVVSLAFDLAGHCPNDITPLGNYSPDGSILPGLDDPQDLPNGFSVYSRVRPQLQMMEQAIKYMLGIL